MKEGWKCPVCGRGVAPDKETCPCASNRLPAPWKPIAPYGPPYTMTGTDHPPTVRFLEPMEPRGPSWH